MVLEFAAILPVESSGRDENGDVDEALIPEGIKAWYVNSSDEEETVSERDSDVEIDSDDQNSCKLVGNCSV